MGKLSSLKKEINKDPKAWYEIASITITLFGKVPCGAKFVDGGWRPIKSGTPRSYNRYSYALYVRKVLWDIGIKTDKPRSVYRPKYKPRRAQYASWH